MDDPIWMSVELTQAIHDRQLAEHGGMAGIRDIGTLESALGRPRQHFSYADPTPTISELAADYAFGLAKNHPFIDGNKRTAYVLCRTFLILNGYDITASKPDRYGIFLQLAAGEIKRSELAHWLTDNTQKV